MTPHASFAILGASGFTGRAVLHYLRTRLRQPLSWIIAGRDPRILATLAEGFAPGCEPQLVVADVHNEAELDALAGRVQWLANLVGPYAATGYKVVEACLRQNTHYLDICGELDVVAGWVKSYHQRARKLKLQLVPAAGFESQLFDISTRAAMGELGGDANAPASVDILLSYTGLDYMQFGDQVSPGSLATYRDTLQRRPDTALLLDPFCLARPAANEAVAARNRLRLQARYNNRHQVWQAPLVPGPFINPAVVHRSNHLLGKRGYGPEFAYQETMNVSSLAPWPWGQAAAAQAIATLTQGYLDALRDRGGLAGATSSFLRSLAAGSEPPSPAALDRIGYQVDILAERQGQQGVHLQVRGLGHPGYRSTGNIVGETLFALQSGPRTNAHGVLTPALALGRDWLEKLQPAGISSEFGR